jgi:hypothetical protein
VADIREHVAKAENNASELEAATKWEEVKTYALTLSPDFAPRNPRRISERTQTAIRAAGGLSYVRECSTEELQWSRKRFIECYLRWGELQENRLLLPDGPIKNLLAEAAQKLLPPSKPVAAPGRSKLLVEQAKLTEALHATP